jgi:Putative DNA-binding domain
MTAWSQPDFADRLIDRAKELPPGVTSWSAPAPERRFNVYRNNMRGALAEALAVRYPATQRIVGDEFFQAMARDHAMGNLPRSPVLIEYGADFPAFIARFPSTQGLPYLVDVARLESAWWTAYHAANDEPLAPDAFAMLDPANLAGLRVEMLSSLAIVSSIHPVVSIWRTNTADAEVGTIDLEIAEDALIARPELDVEVRNLPPGGAVFLSLLQQGMSLGDAAATAAEAASAFDLAANLAGLMQSRIVKAFL